MTAMAALLQRAPGWPQRLAELICARLARPFEWGPNDCAAFGADAAAALTCADPLAELRSALSPVSESSKAKPVRLAQGLHTTSTDKPRKTTSTYLGALL